MVLKKLQKSHSSQVHARIRSPELQMTKNNVEFDLQKVNYSLRSCKSYLLNLILKLTPCIADLKCRENKAKTIHGKLQMNLFFQEIN